MGADNCELQVKIYIECISYGIGIKVELVVRKNCVDKLEELRPEAIIFNPGEIKLRAAESSSSSLSGAKLGELNKNIVLTLSKFLGAGDIKIDLNSDETRETVWFGTETIENPKVLEKFKKFLKEYVNEYDITGAITYAFEDKSKIRLVLGGIEKRIDELEGKQFDNVEVLIKFEELKTCLNMTNNLDTDLDNVTNLDEAIADTDLEGLI